MDIRILIVAQDATVLRKLSAALDLEDDFEVIGAYQDVPAAVVTLRQSPPDVLFLETDLPREQSCDEACLMALERSAAACVLIGSRTGLCIPSLALPAVDCLVKPFGLSQLAACLDRVRRWAADRTVAASPTGENRRYDAERLIARRGAGFIVILLNDIEYITAAGNYLSIQLAKETYQLREKIGVLYPRLPPDRFIRIHRSHIVNKAAVSQLYADGDGGYLLVLRTGRHLPIGPTYAAGIRRWLDGAAHLCHTAMCNDLDDSARP